MRLGGRQVKISPARGLVAPQQFFKHSIGKEPKGVGDGCSHPTTWSLATPQQPEMGQGERGPSGTLKPALLSTCLLGLGCFLLRKVIPGNSRDERNL